jgi:hypothetical protein
VKSILDYLLIFCVIFYKDEKFSFNDTEVLEYIRKSALLSDISFKAEDFLTDLLESVCILQQDGLEIGFSHRSFQEYFTAVYLVNMRQEKLIALLPQLARRGGTDSVFTMMKDMNYDLFESAYVIPMINKARRREKFLGDKPSAVAIATAYKLNVVLYLFIMDNVEFRMRGSRDIWTFRASMMTLYPEYFEVIKERMPSYLENYKRVWKLIQGFRPLVRKGYLVLRTGVNSEDELSERSEMTCWSFLKTLRTQTGYVIRRTVFVVYARQSRRSTGGVRGI